MFLHYLKLHRLTKVIDKQLNAFVLNDYLGKKGKDEDNDFSKKFRTISSKISSYWEWIARCIPPKAFDDSEIEAIKKNHRDDVRAQAYQMLTEWKQKWGSEASPKNLCKALLDEEKRSTASELFGSNMVHTVDSI